MYRGMGEDDHAFWRHGKLASPKVRIKDAFLYSYLALWGSLGAALLRMEMRTLVAWH